MKTAKGLSIVAFNQLEGTVAVHFFGRNAFLVGDFTAEKGRRGDVVEPACREAHIGDFSGSMSGAVEYPTFFDDAPPMLVPTVTEKKDETSFPAPSQYSPRAAQLVSFSTLTGSLNSSSNIVFHCVPV